ncbi:hypothetical protein PHYBLDRAFT_141039 [Phycomyces blakesleeanus NRRL 1555(-)]|uniref:Uncharacterized protein n=1 Tax=Phycomyces blakesleeanus (strain ATCC 8743b / DSM 1359 / FGSC 10004 / NBRC 33097 / NRRL 1555) TaxID=763407 RepID=A0A162UZD9_PHYB8|nr:hypothetical protein PHYBLDRAFT_141039 [Phycomyces blakesleeanus NRRL 1555(-)]OAD78982.1 hypothetical protein PHYBLDRAFT_141039 [Phycomyces blakesleeanus NRRL 1555(-)]|eukprot:XP_018297022.1 hypothetical protein PHYBLDRAFT_141039 [Phycomyces blakesleeanus NRRL 1555(-)]
MELKPPENQVKGKTLESSEDERIILNNDENLSHRKIVSRLSSSSAIKPPKLCEEYKNLVVVIVDAKPDIVLEEMMEKLNTQFMGPEIEKSLFHDFLTNK